MPETEVLRWSTHNGIRKTLFFTVFRQVKYLEYKRLKNEEEFFELKHIEPCEEGIIDKFVETYISKEALTGKLMQTQKWTMNRNNSESEGYYRIKIYHMDNDEFKAKVYP